MKGVILAGGLGTRLYPLTKVTNKHLLPVYNKPMIYYPIQTLVNAGIRDILLVTGGNGAGDFLRLLGNGKEFGLEHLNYTYQEGEGGIAAALSLAEYFANRGPICVVLGDNIIEKNIIAAARAYEKQGGGAKVLLKEVKDPQRFGVAVLDGERLVRIEEKPKEPKSPYITTGIYFYQPDAQALGARRVGDHRCEQRLSRARQIDVGRPGRLVDRRRHVRVTEAGE